MIRHISTKWVLAVLATVVVPFVGFAWYVDGKLAHRLSWDVVHYFLLSRAADLADQVDRDVRQQGTDIERWAGDPLVAWSIGEAANDHEGGAAEDEPQRPFTDVLRRRFDNFLTQDGAFDVLVAVTSEGRYAVSSSRDRHGQPLPSAMLRRLRAADYSREEWFTLAMTGELAQIDHHFSLLLHEGESQDPHDPASHHIGFAAPVIEEGVAGVVCGLVNWSHYQDLITGATRRDYLEGLIGSDIYSSSYAWLWGADADTILAHPSLEILGTRVSEPPVSLPQMVEAARASSWGMYPEYEFRGEMKNAAFSHCAGPDARGFGWVVGIGIDNDDIYGTVNELRQLLIKATVLVLGVVVLWTFFIARRTTRPILELEKHTRRVASGDLHARIDVATGDELGQLADAFNRMTVDLRESRAKQVKAEKEAAWREMARQVAHEIKNPLTPISLSVDLLKRARDEKSGELDAILARTIDLIQRQVENMRRIASDFHAFAGEHQTRPRDFDLLELVDEVLALNAAWAEQLGVRVESSGASVLVHADPGEARRVLINLVSNALESMPRGGRLDARISVCGERARVEIRDTGVGLSAEARERLFEPYFTTRSHGTGLGLAICKRIVDELGGEIEITPADGPGGAGTVARVHLPLAPP